MLLRGINRQIVVINDTGNELFESAIFVINEKGALGGDIDMAAAAREILDRCALPGALKVKKKRRMRTGTRIALCALCAAVLCAAAFFLLR